MLTTLRSLWSSFVGMPIAARVALAAAALLAVLIGLALAVVLSPLFVFLFFLTFLVCAVVLVFRFARRRPGGRWLWVGAASFVLFLGFSGASAALYGGGEQAEPPRDTARTQPEPREETTRPAETTAEETTRPPERTREQQPAREPEPEPEPEPVVEPPPEPERETVLVARVVDGDTIEISPAVDGIDTVRLLGIDTPESKEPGCAPQPLGTDAASYASSVWGGSEVELEFDQEKTDRYDRLLAYVHDPAGTTMNEEILRAGYAQVWIIAPNDAREGELRAAQQEARSIGLGIWALPPGEQARLSDHGNGIGSGDGACAPEQPEEQYQYDAPNVPNPNVPNPDIPEPSPAPPPSDSGTCEGVIGPIPVAPGDPRDGDNDLLACE